MFGRNIPEMWLPVRCVSDPLEYLCCAAARQPPATQTTHRRWPHRWLRERGQREANTQSEESFGSTCHPIDVRFTVNKWWPLPSHDSVPEPRSKFKFLKMATVVVSFCSAPNAKPNDETVWLESWDVPLSDRLVKSGLHLKSLDT
jgi:hypothetical protein